MRLRGHVFLYICLALLVGLTAISYHRFMLMSDYIVAYEGECDPASESCFEGCEDEACTEVYYYAWIRKQASDARRQCGTDTTDCEAAGVCLPSDTACEVTYCSPETIADDESCEELEEADFMEEGSSEGDEPDETGSGSEDEEVSETEITPI